jgi:serine/threonine protein kinase
MCSLGETLGSGQFGTVLKGEWQKDKGEEEEEKEEIEVAVKILKKGSKASSTIKFLREAAIMGQFSHPNVVKLHGVITEGEPVRMAGRYKLDIVASRSSPRSPVTLGL